MRHSKKLIICIGLGTGALWTAQGHAQTKVQALTPQEEIIMPLVKGGFDLMTYDRIHGRLFLSAQDNHTVEVLDLKNYRLIQSLTGYNEPKWVFYHETSHTLYVATGKDGRVTEVDADTFKPLNVYQFKEKCNNLRFDPATQQLFVGVGQSFGTIGIIDLRQRKITGEIALAAFPKQFNLTMDRIYVNVPEQALVQVIDRKTAKVIAGWPVKCERDNIPMAMDEAGQRLYIGCSGGQLITLSAISGKETGRISIPKDVDGIYFDSKLKRLYVSCGEGFLEVFSCEKDKVSLIQQIRTRKGAGTGLFIREAGLYVLAEPQTKILPAALRVFKIKS